MPQGPGKLQHGKTFSFTECSLPRKELAASTVLPEVYQCLCLKIAMVQDKTKHRLSRLEARVGKDADRTCKADAKRSRPTPADAEPPTPTKRAKAEFQVAGKRQVIRRSGHASIRLQHSDTLRLKHN